MRKLFFFVLTFSLLLYHCSEEKPLEITSFALSFGDPAAKALLDREGYILNGSFLPGYQNGNIRSTQVTLNWLASTDADFLCYRIIKDNNQLVSITDISVSTFVDSASIQPDTYYDYKIATVLRNGIANTDTLRLKTPLFSKPENLNFQILNDTTVKIFWENETESADDFNIYRFEDGDSYDSLRIVGSSSDTFFVDTDLTNLETYIYQVEAYNDFETTRLSDSLFVYVNYVMNTPQITSVQQIFGTRSVRIQWNDNSNAEDGFRILRREQNTNFSLIGTVSTDVTEFVDDDTVSSLQIDSTYYYGVAAYNQNESTDTSNVVSVSIDTLLFYYYEDFEDNLGSEWTFNSSLAQGRIERSTVDAHSGQYMLLMDVSSSGSYNLNSAYLHIDLSALDATDDCYLRFYYHTYGEEYEAGIDGVFLSSDGINFNTQAYNLTTSDNAWTYVEINLHDFIGSESYSSTYTILWQQYDNYSYSTDGIGIDDVEISNQ